MMRGMHCGHAARGRPGLPCRASLTPQWWLKGYGSPPDYRSPKDYTSPRYWKAGGEEGKDASSSPPAKRFWCVLARAAFRSGARATGTAEQRIMTVRAAASKGCALRQGLPSARELCHSAPVRDAALLPRARSLRPRRAS